MLKRLVLLDSQKVIIALAIYITLFANYTFFTKLYNFAIVDENRLLIYIVPVVVFILLVLVLNAIAILTQKYLLKATFSLLIVVCTFSAYFMNSFSIIIDRDMITNVMETDIAEASELMTLRLLLYLLLLCIIPLYMLYRYPIEFKKPKDELVNRAIFIGLSSIALVVIFIFFSRDIIPFMRNHKELTSYLNPSYPITSFISYTKRQIKKDRKIIPIATDARIVTKDKKKLYILVVGETARAKNFSLNGYDRETNPLLKNREDVFSLSNFYSCGTATATSLPCMFSKFSKDSYDDDKRQYENLVDVLASVGVRVIYRDNNSGGSKGVATRLSDVKYYDALSYDEVMFESLEKDIDLSYQDTLIVLHQEGSHGPTYYKRYPDEFEKFKPTCKTQDLHKCSDEQIINTYDNTILYTDYIIDKAIKLLKVNEPKYDTFLMYASDHGESLGEDGVYLHSMPYFLAPDEQIHIPAIFYFGSGMDDEKMILKENLSKRYSHDNIFHTFLALFGVSTSEYDSELDIFKK